MDKQVIVSFEPGFCSMVIPKKEESKYENKKFGVNRLEDSMPVNQY